MKKTILRTITVVVVAYGAYASLVLAPAWLPALPSLPKLPVLDPQEVLGSVGLLPTDVSRRLDDVRRSPEELHKEATARAEEAKVLFESAVKSKEEERKEAERKISEHAKNERKKPEDAAKRADREIKKAEGKVKDALGL